PPQKQQSPKTPPPPLILARPISFPPPVPFQFVARVRGLEFLPIVPPMSCGQPVLNLRPFDRFLKVYRFEPPLRSLPCLLRCAWHGERRLKLLFGQALL